MRYSFGMRQRPAQAGACELYGDALRQSLAEKHEVAVTHYAEGRCGGGGGLVHGGVGSSDSFVWSIR